MYRVLEYIDRVWSIKEVGSYVLLILNFIFCIVINRIKVLEIKKKKNLLSMGWIWFLY